MTRSHLRLLTIGAILVVLLNAWVAYHALAGLFKSQEWYAHTFQVLSATDEVQLQVVAASSAARAYLLTGGADFENRYRVAAQAAQDALDKVQFLTRDNVSQQARIAVLRHRMSVRFGALDAAINMRRTHPTEPADRFVLGPALSDSPDGGISVKYAITQVKEEEERLLLDRNGETHRGRVRVLTAFLVASVLDVLLLVLAFELLMRAAEARQKLADRAGEIAALNAELTNINEELEKRVDQRTRELAVSNQELEAFSYSVSHDLRAPLRTIDGFSLALKEDFSEQLNEEGQDYINRVRSGVQRMGSLIDALLQLSRVTRSELQREQVDLSTLAGLIFEELKALSPETQAQFVAQAGIAARADPRLVRIAFENLIGNALKYSSRTDQARIEFGSDAREERAVYFIRDNGVGFDMQYVDRLFTAFQRLHGDRDFKGSGIGLATVSRIIRRHHGRIWAEGEVGKGATFFFTLDA